MRDVDVVGGRAVEFAGRRRVVLLCLGRLSGGESRRAQQCALDRDAKFRSRRTRKQENRLTLTRFFSWVGE